MTIKIKPLFFFLLTMLLSCNPSRSQFQSQIDDVEFYQYPFENINRYEWLAEFLEENLDELVHNSNSHFKDCFFITHRFNKRIIPESLRAKLFQKSSSIPSKFLMNIKACKDERIQLQITSDYIGFFDSADWAMNHTLEYKPKAEPKISYYEIIKDTMLNENFRYFIYLYDY